MIKKNVLKFQLTHFKIIKNTSDKNAFICQRLIRCQVNMKKKNIISVWWSRFRWSKTAWKL